MPFNRPLAIIVLLLFMAAAGWWRWSADSDEAVRRSRILMGTVVEITAWGAPEEAVDKAVSAAFAEIARLEELMSPSREGSDVARLNRQPGPVTVAPETAEVLTLGLRIAVRSEGAFDMTLGRLKKLWGIESEAPRIPDPGEIRRALEGTGPQALRLEGRRVVKRDPRLAVDLGGVAKGYALDRAASILETAGVRRASVNAGGDLRLLGRPPERPWRIGIQHPRRPQEVLAALRLEEAAVVTSGDYERFFERDGRRYHHLFDPRSGYPARRCQSATVVAPDAALADALATTVFVLGPQKGLALLQGFPEAEGLIVGADGRPRLTSGLEGRVAWP